MARRLTTSWTWCIGNVTLNIGVGDLFRAPAEAIVNSEQSDFVLSSNPDTISGQIHHRFGPALQSELEEQVQRELGDPPRVPPLLDGDARTTLAGLIPPSLPVGTVLKTLGGNDYEAIFHAGFHDPNVWLHEDSVTNEADHLRVIRACIWEILERASNERLQSVAFPLIGTGVFELDPAMLAHEFFDAVAKFAMSPAHPKLQVWLVTPTRASLRKLIVAGTQAWTHGMREAQPTLVHDLGVGYIDEFFASQVDPESHPKWSTWVWCRYAELVTGYLSFTLCKAEKALQPWDVTAEDRPLGFGRLLQIATDRAKNVDVAKLSPWGVLAKQLILDGSRRIDALVVDRNKLAHGRACRTTQAVRDDVLAFVARGAWRAVARDAGPAAVALDPFLAREGGGESQSVGVLDSVTRRRRLKYLVPASGRTFTQP